MKNYIKNPPPKNAVFGRVKRDILKKELDEANLKGSSTCSGWLPKVIPAGTITWFTHDVFKAKATHFHPEDNCFGANIPRDYFEPYTNLGLISEFKMTRVSEKNYIVHEAPEDAIFLRVVRDITPEAVDSTPGGCRGTLPNLIKKGTVTWTRPEDFIEDESEEFPIVMIEDNHFGANIPASFFEKIDEWETCKLSEPTGDWLSCLLYDRRMPILIRIDSASEDCYYGDYAFDGHIIPNGCWVKHDLKAIEPASPEEIETLTPKS